jgi:Restriction endonuclease BamHI
MRWLRTLVLFDQGGVVSSEDWESIHRSFVRSIERIDSPRGSGRLMLRRKTQDPESKQWNRNGVGYLRSRFLEHMVADEGWQAEGEVDLQNLQEKPELRLYPSMEAYSEPITSAFGDFDFVTTTDGGIRVAIEWETGNISSSHRSLNKLSIVLAAKKIQAGVLILPSRNLYEHLTDRIGNIGELSPYLGMWKSMGTAVERGMLAIAVVEHDELTDDPEFPYLKAGKDGRAVEGKGKRTSPAK